jgi:molybdopterin biosynthesis enzyme
MADQHETQWIARLTPLDDVLARITELVSPVLPRPLGIAAARGRVLAENVIAGPCPAAAMALRDGWAVDSAMTTDAGAYAPAPLPAAVLIDVGEPLPAGADAVAPFDAVIGRDGRYEALAPVAPGEGVLAAAADVQAGSILRRAGQRLRDIDVAVLSTAGLAQVMVSEPRVRVVTSRAQGDARLAVTRGLITRVLGTEGCAVQVGTGGLEAAIADVDVDAIFVIGGTGSGREDTSVHTLARYGRVEAHGIALAPGQTAAFGVAGNRPVLLVPGRLDSALAVWLTVGRFLLGRLSETSEQERTTIVTLTRKIASALGIAEVVPVRCRDGQAEPIASGYLPAQALAQADGWVLVPPNSEGFPAGAEVVLRALP